MAKAGLALPVGTTNGRARVASGAEQMAKLVALAMADGESSNPFNADAGLRVQVFSLDATGPRALVRRGIEQHFARWAAEDRARLEAVNFSSSAPGEVAVAVQYTDLETDEPRDATSTARRA